MKSLQAGFADVAPHVRTVAETLLESFPTDVHLLTGVALSARGILLDLVAVTATAAVMGIDANRDAADLTPPRPAGQAVAGLQQQAELPALLPVYVFWLGDAPPLGQPDDSPALNDAGAIQRYVLQASTQHARPGTDAASALVDLLLRADAGVSDRRSHTPPLRRALRAIGKHIDPGLFESISPVHFARRSGPILPADINKHLRDAMLERENLLEDVNYGKIVPNEYLVEIDRENYRRHYEPIERQVTTQWQQRLLTALNTANSRQGRKVYRFGGGVRVRIRPVTDLDEHEVRIRCRVSSDTPEGLARPSIAPCLERMPGGRQWPLRAGTTTLGRSRDNDVVLDDPIILERRLVSGRHAYIRCGDGRCRLFDGSPAGKASLNGTFVNGRKVAGGGHDLRDGDLIVLAALDPSQPRPDTPGVAGFIFHANC